MKVPDQIIPDWLMTCIAVPLMVIASPALLAIAAIVGVIWLKRKAVGPHFHWSPWFAWYPVDTGYDGKRWLEVVERRCSHMMGTTQYRLSGPSA